MKDFSLDFYEKLVEGYDPVLDRDGVSGERAAHRLAALCALGLTDKQGSHRLAFSKEEKEAKLLVQYWMENAGMIVRTDGAGNVIGRIEGSDSEKTVLCGSHVDTVPNGGHFDGTLGVIAAIEVAEAWQEAGYVPEKSYEAIVFTDEEGARFHGGMTGSKAFMGELEEEKEKKRIDIYGRSFEDVVTENGLTMESVVSAGADLSRYDSYVEVHIEQGKELEKLNHSTGIVTGIAGPVWLKLRFKGEAGHAGNTPMNDRKDALAAAGAFLSSLTQLPAKASSTAVATVGELNVFPNGVNVIPGEVTCTVDVRDIHVKPREKLLKKITSLLEEIEKSWGVSIEKEVSMKVDPVPADKGLQETAAEILGPEAVYLPSGAAHDAMIIGRYLPMAMLFTKSREGISHNPEEWSTLKDCMNTIHVLKKMIEKRCSVKEQG